MTQAQPSEKKRRQRGIACLTGGLLLLAALVASIAVEPRRYLNVVLFSATVVLLLGALSQLTRRKGPLHWIVRLFVYFFVPVTAALVGILLIVDGFVMLRMEGGGRATLLTMALGAGMLLGMVLTILAAKHVFRPNKVLRFFLGMVVMLTFYVSCTFGSFVGYAAFAVGAPPSMDCDYIIVHGCGIEGDRMTCLLQGRVDKALELYHRLEGRAQLVLSGGQGAGETLSEAQAMEAYLLEKGVPQQDMILEAQSTSTEENLRYVKALLETPEKANHYICVTSDYHVFRTCMLARSMDMDVEGVGSKTALYYWPSAMIREYIAIMTHAWWLTGIHLILWIVVCWKARPRSAGKEKVQAA